MRMITLTARLPHYFYVTSPSDIPLDIIITCVIVGESSRRDKFRQPARFLLAIVTEQSHAIADIYSTSATGRLHRCGAGHDVIGYNRKEKRCVVSYFIHEVYYR